MMHWHDCIIVLLADAFLPACRDRGGITIKRYVYRHEAEPMKLFQQAIPLFPATQADAGKARDWFKFLVKSERGNKVGLLNPSGSGLLALSSVCGSGLLPPGADIMLWYTPRPQ